MGDQEHDDDTSKNKQDLEIACPDDPLYNLQKDDDY